MNIVNHQRWMIPNVTSQFEAEFDLLDVLVEDCNGAYAVYRTIIDRTAEHLEDFLVERCAGRGAKLRLEAAQCSFPFLTEEVYRS